MKAQCENVHKCFVLYFYCFIVLIVSEFFTPAKMRLSNVAFVNIGNIEMLLNM